MLWGPFNEAGVLGLLRSLVFVAAVGLLLGRRAWQHFRYRFSLLVFAVSLAEALLLVESGERLYPCQPLVGPVYLLLALSVGIPFGLAGILHPVAGRGAGPGAGAPTVGLRGGAGLAYCQRCLLLVLLMQGQSYNIPIATYHFLWVLTESVRQPLAAAFCID